MNYLLILIFALRAVDCTIPSTFRKCGRKNPDFQKCLQEAAQNAVQQLAKPFKSLNLPSLEPLIVESLTLERAPGAVSVEQQLTNCKLSGLTSAKIEKYDMNFDNKTVALVAVIPEGVLKCEYKMDGQILVLTVKGEGNATIGCKNLRCVYHAGYKDYVKNNKTYFMVDNDVLDAEPEEVYINFENLFGGNKEVGDNINKVLNENAKEIYEERKPVYNDLMKQVVTEVLNRVFAKVSIEEAFE
ncbi:hypothetical protein Zmor_016987 [Zophobas morio]|uniref:Uncharacterized protein n=1 Tax=Zophobas morio TaxID=2755281 RepID=A0AA38I7Z6_9CUCU|nr:hypothetical protein Zmor_016987 [Zophobas morio]